MLQKGDHVPHFEVTQIDGTPAAYAPIWQHRNLLLLSVPESPPAAVAGTVADLRRHAAELESLDTAWVVTRDRVAGVATPGIVIADRWGEIFGVADASSWMAAPDILEWLRFLQYKCPECEGEAK